MNNKERDPPTLAPQWLPEVKPPDWPPHCLPEAKPPGCAWSLQDAEESMPTLSKESQTMLLAMSELLAKHEERIRMELQVHESQTIQALEDLKVVFLCGNGNGHLHPKDDMLASRQANNERPASREANNERPSLKEVSVVPVDNDSSVPAQPLSGVMSVDSVQSSASSKEEDETRRRYSSAKPDHATVAFAMASTVTDGLERKSTAKALLPEYMRGGRLSLTRMWKTQTGVRTSIEILVQHPRFSQTGIQNMIKSKRSEAAVTMAIFLNAVNIGVEADWSMKHAYDEAPVVFLVSNVLFSVFFALELVLRIYAEPRVFFWRQNKDISWNLFDSFLVVFGIVDELISLIVSAPNFTVIRMLRLFRLVRVIRVIRVLRFFRDLRIIVAGIAGAMKTSLWAVGLLFMMMFIVSSCLMQLTAFELDKIDQAQRDMIFSYYGSLPVAMYTLYQSITGGVDWGAAAQPLLDISPFLAVLYSCYIAFAVVCLLNIITGVFVDNAKNIRMDDEEQLVIEGFENRVKWFEEVKNLFESMTGDTGSLTATHFNLFLDDVKVQACFRRLGIDIHETSRAGLFQILDFDNTGVVDLDEFALGLQSLHGAAKAIHVARIHCELKKLKRDLQGVHSKVTGRSSSKLIGRGSGEVPATPCASGRPVS